jgi:predicted AAA+ superfamily ATPase
MEQIVTYLKSPKPIYLTGISGSGKTTLLKNLPNTLFITMQDIEDYDDILKRMKPSILDMLHTIDHKCICVIDNIDIIELPLGVFVPLVKIMDHIRDGYKIGIILGSTIVGWFFGGG